MAMHKTLWLIAASAALIAAPAAAQNEVAEQPVTNETNVTTTTTTTDANVALDANLVTAPPVDNALEPLPPTESELAREAAADDEDDDRGFPWGLLGLVGLIGLLGRRRLSG